MAGLAAMAAVRLAGSVAVGVTQTTAWLRKWVAMAAMAVMRMPMVVRVARVVVVVMVVTLIWEPGRDQPSLRMQVVQVESAGLPALLEQRRQEVWD
jgi:hypothetical protein